jgi:hypothetical protein
MGLPELRVSLLALAKHGPPDVSAFARDMLATWDAVSPDTARKRRARKPDSPGTVPGQVPDSPDTGAGQVPDSPVTVAPHSAVGGRGALVLDLPLGSGSPALSGSSLGNTNQDPPPQSGVSLVPSVKPKKAGTKAPSSVDPSASAWCAGYGIPEPTPGSEAANFLDYWSQRTRDATSLDWAARWRSRPDWTKKQAMNGHGKPGRLVQPPAAPGQKTWKMGEYA